MKLEKGLHPINYAMNFIKSGKEFSLKDISELSGVDEEIVNTVLMNLSFKGYVHFDCNSMKYTPSGKVKYLKNFK